MSTVLTIDQGTSGTKALVVDGDGNLLGLSEHPVRPHYLPGGGVEQDPHELLASVVGAGRAAVSKPACRSTWSPSPTRAKPCWSGTPTPGNPCPT